MTFRKESHRIEIEENYNLSKAQNGKQPQHPKEKEMAINATLEHFEMV